MGAGDSVLLLGVGHSTAALPGRETASYPIDTQVPMHSLHPSHPCSDVLLRAFISYQDVFILVASLLDFQVAAQN